MSRLTIPQFSRLFVLLSVTLLIGWRGPVGHSNDGQKVRPRPDRKLAEDRRMDRDHIERDRELERQDRFEARERRDAAEHRFEIPRGFGSKGEFERFSSICKSELQRAGFDNTHALFQGSAVTGRSFLTGKQFDVGRKSDYDIALCGERLMQRARELGIELRSEGERTKPLDAAEVKKMGLESISNRLSAEVGRPVNFMLYRSPAYAAGRSPSIAIK